MNDKPKPKHLDVTGPQILEGQVVEPPKLDPDNPIQPSPLSELLHIDPASAVSGVQGLQPNIDPDDFYVNPHHEKARLKEVAERKRLEPVAIINKIVLSLIHI